MNKRELFIFIFLSVITLGIYPFIIFNFKSEETTNELSYSKKLSVNYKKLLEILNKDIISGVEYTHSKVKIFIKETKKIDPEEIKNMKGISGVFITSDSVTLIVGNQAKELANVLGNLI